MRKRIFKIIEVAEDNDKCSKIYDTFMMITICYSIFPLAFKNQTGVFNVIDKVSAFIFLTTYKYSLKRFIFFNISNLFFHPPIV